MEIENFELSSIPIHQQIDLTDIISNMKKIKITQETHEEISS